MLLLIVQVFFKYLLLIIIVRSLSHVHLFVTPWTAACQASLSFTISWSLFRVMSIELMMAYNHLILCFPFSSCPPSFPASGSFSMSQFFPSGGQSIGVLASASVLPMNIQGWFPLGWTGLISLLSNGLSEVSNTTVWKHLSAYPWESNCKLCVWNDVTHDCLVRGWCQCNTELQHQSRCTFPRWYILRWSEAELHTFLVCSTRWCYLICKAFKTWKWKC